MKGKKMTDNNKLQGDNDLKKRIISWIVLILMVITIRYMLNIVLLTFIITFVFYNLVELIQRKSRKFLSVQMPNGFILTALYIAFILLLIFASTRRRRR